MAESTQKMMRSYHQLMILILITIVGTGVRLYHLDGISFWLDEGFSARMAQHPSLQAWTSWDNHPPLYYAMLAAWSWPSNSDYWLRLLSVILGVATIPLVYSLYLLTGEMNVVSIFAKRLKNRRKGKIK